MSSQSVCALPWLTVLRTLDFARVQDVTTLLTIDAELTEEVAVFLAARFAAGLRRTWGLDTDAGVPTIESWIAPAAQYFLERCIVPTRLTCIDANSMLPSFLKCMASVKEAVNACVVIREDDPLGRWVALLAGAKFDVDDCCVVLRSPCTAATLSFVQCTEVAFYTAINRGHRECLTQLDRHRASPPRLEINPIDPNLQHMMLPCLPVDLTRAVRSLKHVVRLQVWGFSTTSVEDCFLSCSDSLTEIDLSECDALKVLSCNFAMTTAQLRDVKLPRGLVAIEAAFCMSSRIQRIDLSGCEALRSIANKFAAECHGLTSVNLSGCRSLTSIASDFAVNATALINVEVPSSVVSIGDYFCYRAGLLSLDLSPCVGLRQVGGHFANACKNLTSVNVSGCVALTHVGDAFADMCAKLNVVDVPPGLPSTISDQLIISLVNHQQQEQRQEQDTNRASPAVASLKAKSSLIAGPSSDRRSTKQSRR